jgi:hypothetical protein
METTIDESKIHSLADLRGAIAKMQDDWSSFQGFIAEGLLQRQLNSQIVYTVDSFLLQRFITDLQPKNENYIGEAIIRESGELEYLKTYRLSEAQTRRAYLLSKLAQHNWNLEATAKTLSQTSEDFIARLESAGFGYLLNQAVRDAALKKTKKSRR